MCLSKVYEVTENGEPILEEVAYMRIDGNRVEIETLFGERKVFQGKVRQIDFVNSRVELEKE
jgi:predicted RNA-binding protein